MTSTYIVRIKRKQGQRDFVAPLGQIVLQGSYFSPNDKQLLKVAYASALSANAEDIIITETES